jgi:hypothetical protein
VRNVLGPTPPPPQPGLLTGNGSLFIGTKGMMATVDRGEGVHLLPAARWAEYVLPPPLPTRSPGHMLDPCVQRRRIVVLRFQRLRSLCGMAV